jgi:hypothetical protein
MMDADVNDSGPDTIAFAIPETDPGYDAVLGTWTIRPLTEMRNLIWDDGTLIDGATQAAFIGGDPNPYGPEIVIDGSLAGDESGFNVSARRRVVLNCLVIHGFQYDQIMMYASDSCRISGCFIGTNATGNGRFGRGGTGICITQGSRNIIGGESESDRNVISGNGSKGIRINERSGNNWIMGNYIGIRADGLDTLGNGDEGLHIHHGCGNNRIGPDNVISGNSGFGLVLSDSSNDNTVFGNFIGTDPSGTLAWGNSDGILLTHSSGNRIGGLVRGEGNIISGNQYDGITIANAQSDSNLIIGNRIGVDVSGENPLGNREHGIRIRDGAAGNRIGDGTPEGANIISGNGRYGLLMTGGETAGNRIEGNFIGTCPDEKVRVGNGWGGIEIHTGVNHSMIGPGNAIAYNDGFGVHLQDTNTTENTITGNSIHDNLEPGISTAGGANLELAPPVLNGLNPVSGTSIPGGRVEIFSDSSDEGRIYEGFTTADGAGGFSWSGTPSGPNITATVTDEDGNTSEFSKPFTATAVEAARNGSPDDFVVYRNFPNPFNPATSIRFSMAVPGIVCLRIFNLAGEEVAGPVRRRFEAGEHTVRFDASGLASGIYLYNLHTGDFIASGKMVKIE